MKDDRPIPLFVPHSYEKPWTLLFHSPTKNIPPGARVELAFWPDQSALLVERYSIRCPVHPEEVFVRSVAARGEELFGGTGAPLDFFQPPELPTLERGNLALFSFENVGGHEPPVFIIMQALVPRRRGDRAPPQEGWKWEWRVSK